MKAIWLENQSLSLRNDLPLPIPGQGEALIKMDLAGICSTDLELCRGYYPFTGILGHEFIGHVIEAPENPAWVGKRVVGDINIACGKCATCRRGAPHHCEQRKTLGIHAKDGCFAEYLTLPVINLVEVPESVADKEAVFSEPLAAALEIQEQVHIEPGMQVLALGAGRMGLLIAQTLALTGCQLMVALRRPKLHIEAMLEEWHINNEDVSEIVPYQSDLVVEVTGSAEGFELARKAVRPTGTIVVKSTFKGDVQVNLSSIVTSELTIIGSRCGPHAAALRLLENKRVNTSKLIEGIYPLSQGLQAFDQAAKPGILKILISPE